MKTKGKICLVVSFIVLLFLLIVPYYLYVGRSTTISNDGKDWADFAAYFATFGTMLFTALYAFAFITLQGAINKNTEAQQGKNERKSKNDILLVLGIMISNMIQQSIEKIATLAVGSKMSEKDYHTLMGWNQNMCIYLQSIDKYKNYIAEENQNYVGDMLTNNQKIREDIEFIYKHNLSENYKSGLHVRLTQMANMLNWLETQILVSNFEEK